jgi:hypothetical protein
LVCHAQTRADRIEASALRDYDQSLIAEALCTENPNEITTNY